MTKIVIEVDVNLANPKWSERDLVDNAAYFFTDAIARAEQHHEHAFPDSPAPFKCDIESTQVWTRADYFADAADGKLPT